MCWVICSWWQRRFVSSSGPENSRRCWSAAVNTGGAHPRPLSGIHRRHRVARRLACRPRRRPHHRGHGTTHRVGRARTRRRLHGNTGLHRARSTVARCGAPPSSKTFAPPSAGMSRGGERRAVPGSQAARRPGYCGGCRQVRDGSRLCLREAPVSGPASQPVLGAAPVHQTLISWRDRQSFERRCSSTAISCRRSASPPAARIA